MCRIHRIHSRSEKPGTDHRSIPFRCFETGDLVIFEYHRNPRHDRQIDIANLPEFGPATEAIKRLTQNPTHWSFQSDNPAYEPTRVPKNEIAHPILGTMVYFPSSGFRILLPFKYSIIPLLRAGHCS